MPNNDSSEAFARTIFKRQYYRQQALYLDGVSLAHPGKEIMFIGMSGKLGFFPGKWSQNINEVSLPPYARKRD